MTPFTYSNTSTALNAGRPRVRHWVTHALSAGLLLALALGAQAATLTVTSTADDGSAGTLRSQIAAAASGDTIEFNLTYPATITLPTFPDSTTTGKPIYIVKNLTITGPGAALLTVSGDSFGTVFDIAYGNTVTITGVRIADGFGGFSGGGINNYGTLTLQNSTIVNCGARYNGGGINNRGTLTLQNSTISDNWAWSGGGGINNEGTLTIQSSTIANNSGYYESFESGGGINNRGTLTIQNSTIANNHHDVAGGGIYNERDSTLTIQDSTIANNFTWVYGGGIHNAGTLTIQNSTMSGNSAGHHGGGIHAYDGTVLLNSVTLTANTADNDHNGLGEGGGIFRNSSATVTIRNTIIAGNRDGGGTLHPDVSGTVTSLGHNLIGDGTGSAGFGEAGDQVGTALSPIDPLLGPLFNYGGTTMTHALLAGSPAVNTGDSINFPATDQRGLSRLNGVPDIGAYEAGVIDMAHAFVDAAISSRASQTSVNGLQSDVTLVKTDVGLVKTDVGTIVDKVLGLDSTRLDVAVSSRASQTSVDGIGTKLDTIETEILGLDLSGLNASVSSRASQTSLDAFVTQTSKDVDLLLRAQIERALQDNARVSLYYLPDASRGHLEFVRDIVRATIDENFAAGQITATIKAPADLFHADGVAKMAAGQFKLAYDQFGKAYRTVSK